jgi:hypothetical protein
MLERHIRLSQEPAKNKLEPRCSLHDGERIGLLSDQLAPYLRAGFSSLFD